MLVWVARRGISSMSELPCLKPLRREFKCPAVLRIISLNLIRRALGNCGVNFSGDSLPAFSCKPDKTGHPVTARDALGHAN
jgi:hypothetical protein